MNSAVGNRSISREIFLMGWKPSRRRWFSIHLVRPEMSTSPWISRPSENRAFSWAKEMYRVPVWPGVNVGPSNLHGDKYLCCTLSGQLSLVSLSAGSLRSFIQAHNTWVFGKLLSSELLDRFWVD